MHKELETSPLHQDENLMFSNTGSHMLSYFGSAAVETIAAQLLSLKLLVLRGEHGFFAVIMQSQRVE